MRGRKRRVAIAVGCLVAAAVASVAAAGSVRGIEPFVVAGNPGCADLSGVSFTTQVNFDSPVNGSSASGVYITIDGTRVGWFTLGDLLVKAVIVKGGSSANVYEYTSGQDYSDGGLFPPTNPKNGKPYSLGAIRACY
jgi:hypothetical protein